MTLLRISPRSFPALTFLITVLLGVSPVFAASYYVDYSSGSDNNNGTSTSTAWQHCPGDPAATVVPGSTALTAGDTVIFKGGATYVLTGQTGILLKWNGASGAPITYDGNSAGTWGTGTARFSDNYGSSGIAAFSASGAASNLTFKSLEFAGIGGTAGLPPDTGSAVSARFGAGLLFNGGVTNTTIDHCVFHDLGYWFNQKPMNAASVSGTAIGFSSADTVTVSNSDFYHVASGIEMGAATAVANLTISNCTFHDSVVWTIDLPAAVAPTNLQVSGCTESNNAQFTAASWSGYGYSPRTEVRTVAAGASVTFNVSAVASPAAAFQWYKNGTAVNGATNSSLVLPAIAAADAATYTVVATNTAGSSTSNDAILTLATTTPPPPSDVAPVITTQPVSQTVAAGSSASFSVAASGSPAPTFQWLKNGVAIPGWTSATLTLSNVSTSDAANYSAVATNSAGSTTSSMATLVVTTATVTPTPTPTPSPTPTTSAPVITTQPTSMQTATAGGSVSFLVAASGSPAPTYQWLKNGAPIAGATNTILTLSPVTTADAATYAATATNSVGTATSANAVLVVNTLPVFTVQPQSQTVLNKATVTFSVAASGSPAPTFQWKKDGVAIPGATATSFTLRNVSKSNAGTYTATATNAAGSVTSNGAVLAVNNGPRTSKLTATSTTSTGLAVTDVPLSQTVSTGATTQFSVTAESADSLHYQWAKNDVPVDGATNSSLVLSNVQDAAAGAYTVTVNDSTGSITTDAANLLVTPPNTAPSRLGNLSVRGVAGTGSGTLIVGFVVDGSASKALLVRGVGPALSNFGITDALQNPKLSLYSGSDLMGANNGWSSGSDAAQVAAASNRLGAFRLSEGSPDTALLPTLSPGAYTTHVSDANGGQGTALVELYDAALGSEARLKNVSVRTTVSGGNAPIIGFVVTGSTPKQLLIRAVGPSLASFGVDGVLADPQIEIYKGSNREQQSDDWAGDVALSTAFKRVGAFPLSGIDSKDAAVLFTAEPGAYSAVVSGVNNASGVVIVEVYEVP